MSETTTPTLPDLQSIWQESLGWQPTASQQAQFEQLYHAILAGNRRLNLTRITDPLDFWEKHLWDSLRGIRQFLQQGDGAEIERVGEETGSEPSPVQPQSGDMRSQNRFSAIDIGTGAGFPGSPIAIVQPDWIITLLDSTRKKIEFLNSLVKDLSITNAIPCSDRVEQLGRHP
jgi:16S rRNA (guanine527-N7)-methyltransferase